MLGGAIKESRLARVRRVHNILGVSYIYKSNGGRTARKQDTQANKRSPPLSEEIPYQITLDGLSQGSVDRRRREKVIWKMFTENDCYTFTDLEGES
jgi:hypothetical protein